MTKVTIDRELLADLLSNDRETRINAERTLYAILAHPTQQGEAVEVVGWRRIDKPYELTAYPSVCAMWHGNGWPVQALYANRAASVPPEQANAVAIVDSVICRKRKLFSIDIIDEEKLHHGTKLYTHPAATAPAGCKVVPVELLERVATHLEWDGSEPMTTIQYAYKCDGLAAELRALLASAEGVKDE